LQLLSKIIHLPYWNGKTDNQPLHLHADALGRPSGTVADDVVAYLKENPLPKGIQMTWGSDIKRQNDSFGALGSVLLISFLLIYLIMVALYDSFVYPFVVLFSIPSSSYWGIFRIEFVVKQFEFICLTWV
jgi:HAE1 family hydrophobic/amphiphilic exporter-1